MTQSQGAGAVFRDTVELEKLETLLADLRRHIRCLRRAVLIMSVLVALAAAGLCYCTVLLPNFPQSFAQFLMESSVRFFCALGLASFTCLFAFSILQFVYCAKLDRQRELRRACLIGV